MTFATVQKTVSARPLLVGLITVLTVIAFGVGIGFATGFTVPTSAFAFGSTDTCCGDVNLDGGGGGGGFNPLGGRSGTNYDGGGGGPGLIPPVCTLTSSADSIVSGGSVILTWTGNRGVTLVIDQGIGAVTPVSGGTVTTGPLTATKTFTATITKASGETATCSDTVVVTYPPAVPSCTLTASPSSIEQGSSTSLSWTTTNATSLSIDNGVGNVTPIASGSQLVLPTATTYYSATVTGLGGTSYCMTTVTVTPPPAPSCTLIATPASISEGGTTILTWTTTNGVSFELNQGIGLVTPVQGGSLAVSPHQTTYYSGTVTNATGEHAYCMANVVVTPPAVGCKMEITKNVDRQSASPGDVVYYSMSYKNVGDKKCTGVKITDELDSRLMYLDDYDEDYADYSYGSDHIQRLSWDVGEVAPEEGGSVMFRAKVGYVHACMETIPNTALLTYGGYWGMGETKIESNVVSLSVSKDCTPKPTKISATKIVCEKEADLPNWSSADVIIAGNTANDYVDAHPSCHLEKDWKFEWANGGTSNPGDNTEVGGEGWTVFPATNSNGVSVATITSFSGGKIWVREQLQHGYIPFSGIGVNNNSAEMYCHTDVLNYDNFDFISNPQENTTYYCVAFNVKKVVPPHDPVCTLSANPTTIQRGGSTVLSWNTTNVTATSINQGVGAVTPVDMGSVSVSPTTHTTYTMTATHYGKSTTCTAYVHVTEPPPNAPSCTLTADPSLVDENGNTTLTWTTTHASNVSLDEGIGAVDLNGSKTVTVSATTLYTLTATGAGGDVTCNTQVTVNPPPPPTPACTLTADKSTIEKGDEVTLTWTGTNVDVLTFDNDIGAQTPATGGSIVVSPRVDTTYMGTWTGDGGVTNCSVEIKVNKKGLSCELSVSPVSIAAGETATLSWGGTNISTVTIDNGIGTRSGAGSETIQPSEPGTRTYHGSFSTDDDQVIHCSATLEVTTPGCTSNCGGGGGGGGSRKPRVTFDALTEPEGEVLSSFVYLSQVPYTGLDLGPLGTVVYWLVLVVWSLAAAYLVLFNVLPFAYRRVRGFGEGVKQVVNTNTPAPVAVMTQTAPVVEPPPVLESHANFFDHSFGNAIPEAPRGYSAHDGFRSFANSGVLTVDDVVRGLSRLPEDGIAAYAPPAPVPHSSHAYTAEESVAQGHNVEPIHSYVPPAPAYEVPVIPMPGVAPAPVYVASSADGIHDADVFGFVSALIAADRDAVFGFVRHMNRSGIELEKFLTRALHAIDDSFRARIEGAHCDPEMLRITSACSTPTLEKLVTSLATAVDSSYSAGITGAKLALTRALTAIEG